MMAKIITFLMLIVAIEATLAADAIILSSSSLGPLQLTDRPVTVSEAKLKKLFPEFSVKYEIGSGDSPNFHYFQVADADGRVLFSIQSFIVEPNKAEKTTSEVPVSLLRILSSQIPDEYGLHVGDRVKDIIAKRGNDLKFGVGHMDGLMGDGYIYYSLLTDSEANPESLTKEDAVNGNWRIRFISWPEAAWE